MIRCGRFPPRCFVSSHGCSDRGVCCSAREQPAPGKNSAVPGRNSVVPCQDTLLFDRTALFRVGTALFLLIAASTFARTASSRLTAACFRVTSARMIQMNREWSHQSKVGRTLRVSRVPAARQGRLALPCDDALICELVTRAHRMASMAWIQKSWVHS